MTDPLPDFELAPPPHAYVPPVPDAEPRAWPERATAPRPMEAPQENPWQPIPLAEASVAAGDAPRPVHGQGTIYGGPSIVIVSSEPGLGKSFLSAIYAAEEVKAGGRPLYLDFERTATLLDERLSLAGLSEDDRNKVSYLRPTMRAEPAEIRRMVAELEPTLIVVDAYDSALHAFGYETKNEDIRAFNAIVLDPLREAAAPIVIPDHVPKDQERRGRYSIGGQAKLAVAEAHLGVTAITPLRRNRGGKLKLKVHKDTYGWLPFAALVTVNSHELTGALSWRFALEEDGAGAGDEFRPTGLMEKVSRFVEAHPVKEKVSRAQVEEAVGGKRKYVRDAMDALTREGYLDEVSGPRGARHLTSARPFREDEE